MLVTLAIPEPMRATIALADIQTQLEVAYRRRLSLRQPIE